MQKSLLEIEEVKPLTAFEIVRETLEYYAEGGRFSVSKNGMCLYLDSQTNNRCAVGRCFATDEFDSLQCGIDSLVDDYGFKDKHLKPQYRGQGVEFWCHLQLLHDNWAKGRVVIEYLRRLCAGRESGIKDLLEGVDFKVSIDLGGFDLEQI